MLISGVIYYYAGPLVASPALGSASPLVSKICFGIALPTIVVAGVVNGSVVTKYIYRHPHQQLEIPGQLVGYLHWGVACELDTG
jgi:hypothetical protein